jgi:hypothetical protein
VVAQVELGITRARGKRRDAREPLRPPAWPLGFMLATISEIRKEF